MNRLVKTQSNFLRLIISTPSVQQRALIKTILPSQMKAIVQIVYNTLIGNRIISAENKKKLKKHKVVIRRFVSKGLSFKQRKEILFKYFKYILLMLKIIEKEL